jgi:hypothetical protein
MSCPPDAARPDNTDWQSFGHGEWRCDLDALKLMSRVPNGEMPSIFNSMEDANREAVTTTGILTSKVRSV